MNLDDDGAEAVNNLFNDLTPTAIQIFECLADSNGMSNGEIAEVVGCDSSTASTLTGKLKELNISEWEDNGNKYLTSAGECIEQSLLDLAIRWAVVSEHLSPFFSQLDTTADTGLEKIVPDLITAEVQEGSGKVEDKGFRRYTDLIDSHNYVRELSTVRTTAGRSYSERLNDDLKGEFVLKKSFADDLRSSDPTFPESLVNAEGAEFVKETETQFDFTISIFKDSTDSPYGTVALIQDKDFVIVISEERSVVEWAEDCFERYAARGEEIPEGK